MMNDRFKFRVPVFYDGKFKAFKKYSLCNGVVIWKEPETIGELWIEDELKRNNPHLSLGHDEQCTGLKDKNGKLIYEGDIIENGAGKRYVIFWCPEKLGFVARTNNPNKVLESLDIYYMPWKVIGNIHENPELLESEER